MDNIYLTLLKRHIPKYNYKYEYNYKHKYSNEQNK